MIDGYATIKEIAERWGITTRRVQVLCSNKKISGAVKFGRAWAIPQPEAQPAFCQERSLRRLSDEPYRFVKPPRGDAASPHMAGAGRRRWHGNVAPQRGTAGALVSLGCVGIGP